MINDYQDGSDILLRLRDLVDSPRESPNTEVKGWLDLNSNLDKANLAHAILALANYGGGYVLIGFIETNGQWEPSYSRPANLDLFSQDVVNGVVQKYAEPPFHCDVYLIKRPSDQFTYPVIGVPGGHTVPIRAARSGPGQKHVQQYQYYTRSPGPSSSPIASAREWDDVISRCIRNKREELIDNFRELLFGHTSQIEQADLQQEQGGIAKDSFDMWIEESLERWQSLVSERLKGEEPSRFHHGIWWVAYRILDEFSEPSLKELMECLREVKGRESGWPPWLLPRRQGIEPFPYNGSIECCLFEKSTENSDIFQDAAHSDFWKASPSGMMFLVRGYQEDGLHAQERDISPGTIFDLTLPVWRVGECLLHAGRLGQKLVGENSSVEIKIHWEGLSGRKLETWANPHRMLFEGHVSHQNSITTKTKVESGSITSNLPEVVQALTSPLYEIFDFFSPPPEMYHEELGKMRGR